MGFTCLEGGFAVGIVNHGQRELGRVDAMVLVGYIDIRLVCEEDVDCSATALAVSASTPSFSADAPNDVADVKTCIGHGTGNDGGKGGRVVSCFRIQLSACASDKEIGQALV